MDKRIVDELVKFGLITNINVNHEAYESVDDLINKGVVTVPGAKEKILEIIEKIGVATNILSEPVVEVLLDEKPINDVPVTELNIVDETPESEPVIDETPESEPVIDETPESEPVVVTKEDLTDSTEQVVETSKKVKKSTKKTE